MKKTKYMFSIYAGATPDSKNSEYWDGDIVWITPADYKTTDKYISCGAKSLTKAGYNASNTTIVPAGSIIVSKRAPIGTVSIAEVPLCTNQGCLSCVPNDDVDSSFAYYALSSMSDEMQVLGAGTTFKEISANAFANMKIPYFPLPEQHAIVRYLDAKCAAIDEAIGRHKKIIEKLEEYKRSSIIKAVNGDISDNTKASGIAWMPTVPSHWGVVPMRFALTQRKNKNEGLVEKNLLTLSYGKIKRKDIETNEGLLPASFEGYNIIEAGDIVLRLMDLQNDKHSLRTGLVTERGIITSAYVTVVPTEGFDPAYCRYLLHAYDLMKVFYSMGEGVRQGLTYDDLSRTLLIPKPPIDEQSKIASNIIKMESSVDASIGKQNAMLKKLEEYRKSIIYNAVTGKIDCRTETQP